MAYNPKYHKKKGPKEMEDDMGIPAREALQVDPIYGENVTISMGSKEWKLKRAQPMTIGMDLASGESITVNWEGADKEKPIEGLEPDGLNGLNIAGDF